MNSSSDLQDLKLRDFLTEDGKAKLIKAQALNGTSLLTESELNTYLNYCKRKCDESDEVWVQVDFIYCNANNCCIFVYFVFYSYLL